MFLVFKQKSSAHRIVKNSFAIPGEKGVEPSAGWNIHHLPSLTTCPISLFQTPGSTSAHLPIMLVHGT